MHSTIPFHRSTFHSHCSECEVRAEVHAAMDCQLRGYKFLIVITFFAILSLMIYGSMLQTSSVGKETTFKDHFRRLIWSGDRDLSGTTKSSNKSTSPLEAKFKVEKLLKKKYSKFYDTISKNSTSSGAGYCKVPPGGFKSWTKGSVTKVTPEIHANCTLLFEGRDYFEVAQVQLTSYTWPAKEHALIFEKWVKESHCIHFKDELEDNFYTTKEELDFPLAFALLIHNSPFQIYRLLKVIYRPISTAYTMTADLQKI